MNRARAAWRGFLARHAPVDPWPPESALGRLDAADNVGRRGPVTMWAPGEPIDIPPDAWASDPDRTTRRNTYRKA